MGVPYFSALSLPEPGVPGFPSRHDPKVALAQIPGKQISHPARFFHGNSMVFMVLYDDLMVTCRG